MGGQYAYRNTDWTGYQMRPYQIDPQFIEQYGLGIFQYFDRDRSGSLDMNEVPQMVYKLFDYLQLAPPNIQDIYFSMNQFDVNRDGRIGYPEYRRLLYFLAGKPCPDQYPY